MWILRINQCLLEQQPGILITEPSLQPVTFLYNLKLSGFAEIDYQIYLTNTQIMILNSVIIVFDRITLN